MRQSRAIASLCLICAFAAGACNQTGPSPIPDPPSSPAPGPTAPASTGPIAFVSTRDGSHAIYLANEDGSKVTRLAAASVLSYPAWSPDRRRLAFVRQPEIYVVNIDGSGLRRIWSQDRTWGPVDWSPDGSKIAFTACCGTDKGIFVMNSDGSEVTRLISHESVAPGCIGADSCGVESPTWSPDGRQIAFEAWGGYGFGPPSGVVIINVDGTLRRFLSEGGSSPAWSPDGSKIAFHHGGPREIGLVNADGSGRPLLLHVSGEDPRWAPDGSLLFSALNDAGRRRVFITAGTGSRRQLIPEATAPANPGYEDCCAVWAR